MNNQTEDYCPVEKQDLNTEVKAQNLPEDGEKATKKWTAILIIVVFVLLSVSTILMYLILFNKKPETTINESTTTQEKQSTPSNTLESLQQEIKQEKIKDFETDLQAIEQDIEQL